MLDKKYLARLKKDSLAYAEKRREVIKTSDDALHLAKRAIFALHRHELKEAEQKLREAERLLKSMQKKYANDTRLADEGANKAGLEEYTESALFYQFCVTGKIGQVTDLAVDPETYLAGLCDIPGELLRYAIAAATEGDVKTVKKCAETAQEIVGELIEFNLTKYLRHKFDQAKEAVRKLEQVVYEVSLQHINTSTHQH